MAKTARLAALGLALFVWSTASSGAQGQFQTRFDYGSASGGTGLNRVYSGAYGKALDDGWFGGVLIVESNLYGYTSHCSAGSSYNGGCRTNKAITGTGTEAAAMAYRLITGGGWFTALGGVGVDWYGTWYPMHAHSTTFYVEAPPEPCDYFSCHQVDPMAVATGSSPEVNFSSLEDGVMFDGDGDGILEFMSWPVSGGGWLALDRDGDGRITSGRELLGNHTLPDTANGFDAIARLLPKPKGYITPDDPLFHQLVVWTDANRDGIGEGSELEPLSKYVTEILLSYERVDKKDQHGNRYRWRGKAKYVGKQGWVPIYDVVVLTSQP